jgi:hypothetical protein
LHNGKAGATFRSDIDNYMNDIMERNNKDFLVPMGYVSLQKPNEYFNKYMRFRLKRDILRSWLYCENEAMVEESSIDNLIDRLLKELDYEVSGTIANDICKSDSFKELMMYKNDDYARSNSKGELAKEWRWDTIQSCIDECNSEMEKQKKAENIDEVKRIVINSMWKLQKSGFVSVVYLMRIMC